MALDLIRDAEGDVVGVTALEMETGELHILQAKTVLLATGGAGRIFAASTNAFINTGDGLGMAARAGDPARGHGVLAVPPDRRRTAPACCSPKAAAARARSCATAPASASWSATRRP